MILLKKYNISNKIILLLLLLLLVVVPVLLLVIVVVDSSKYPRKEKNKKYKVTSVEMLISQTIESLLSPNHLTQ